MKPLSFKFFVICIQAGLLIATLVGIPLYSTSSAADLTATYQVPLSNDYCIVSNNFGYLGLTLSGNFDVPLIDSSKFAIASVSFELSGTMGGVSWLPPFGNNFQSFISLKSSVGGYMYSTAHNAGPAKISLAEMAIYPETDIDPGLEPANLYIGSPNGQGGYIQLPVTNAVVNYGSWGGPYGIDYPANLLDFIGNFVLTVTYELNTNSSGGTTSDLPPVIPLTSSLVFIQENTNALVPSSLNLPSYVLQADGLYISGIQAQGTNLLISWNTLGGTTNYVQASPSLDHPNFSDISGPIVIPGNSMISTNFLVVGGATNGPSQFYQIRLVQ